MQFWQNVATLHGCISIHNLHAAELADLSSSEGYNLPADDLQKILKSVKSVYSGSEALFSLDLCTMEKISVREEFDGRYINDSWVILDWESYRDFKHSSLPNLKEIDVYWRSGDFPEEIDYYKDFQSFARLLFNSPRPNVSHLKISSPSIFYLPNADDVVLFRPIYIRNFPSLKKLVLDLDERFKQEDYIELLGSLVPKTKLEHLELKMYSYADDDFFFGHNREQPLFLQMRRK